MDATRPSLLIRVKDRDDQAAWREFDSIYRPLLCRIALAHGLNPNEADEIAQQCMTAVDRYIGGFDYDPKKGKFKSWLATMVNNRIKNMIRDRRDVQARTRDFDGLREQGSSPEEAFDRVWRQEHLKHCLGLVRSDVEAQTFDAFVAYVMDEQPIERVCGEFKMTANQVHAIKSRMVRRIRQRMIEIFGEEE